MSADSAPAVVNSAPLSTRQINKRILSIVIFTFVCYLTIGLPLAVLPSFVHNHLGYSNNSAKITPSGSMACRLF
ncbi:Major facilitator superfamily MFS_1 [Yersinia thracica]|uniref:Major facilitator superfamily MFS_1 n=1 Tax=Yersinia thracica TaxID=2890319 RepID=A0A0T9QPI9_9GAMM|nr:Major facilitator superfamily MFS_1 [Yersinia thracica]